jgi:hypothetical protein
MGGLVAGAIGGLIIGSSAGAGGSFGLTRARPLCARPSDQSTVAPRSFSTLEATDDRQVAVALHHIVLARNMQCAEGDLVDVLAVRDAADLHPERLSLWILGLREAVAIWSGFDGTERVIEGVAGPVA